MAQKRKLNRGLEALLGTGLLAKGQDGTQAAQTPAAEQGALMPVAELPIERLQRGTCLLYTSPSPRDQRGSRMPSSA